MPTMSLRFSKEDDQLFRDYAKLNGMSINELFRQSAIEKIESEVDVKLYDEAMKEFEKNPVVYSHEDVKEQLGL